MTLPARSKHGLPWIPNALCLFRGVLGLLLPCLILRQDVLWHQIALALFVIGFVTDYFDGYLARRWGCITGFGKIADPTADKILILGPLAAFASLGYYSIWWTVPIFIREIIVTFCRIGWLLEGKAMGAEKLGKVKFFSQVLVLAACFLVLLGVPLKAYLVPLLALALALTILSGMTFLGANRRLFKGETFARFTSASGVGLLPGAPGTWGSLLGLALYGLVQWNTWLLLSTFVFLILLGAWAVGRIDLSKNHDPGFVVIDEVCGMFVALWALPLSVATLVTGFVLFRLFDILKPPPVNWLERVPGYWGILLDDLAAGLWSWLVLYLLFVR